MSNNAPNSKSALDADAAHGSTPCSSMQELHAVKDKAVAGKATTAGKAVSSGKVANGALARAMRVLEEITASGPIKFSELQSRLGLPKASLHRVLNDLQAERLIAYDVRALSYDAGFRILELANQIWGRSDLRSLARDQLESLCKRSGETVQLSVLADTHAVYIDCVESSNNVRMSMSIGDKVPVYCTGAGKVLLAHCEPAERQAIVKRISFAAYTANTVTAPEQLLHELDNIRRQGYAEDNEELYAGSRCVAVPVFNFSGAAIAAISISAPTFRTADSQAQQWRGWLLHAGAAVSAKLSPATR